MTNIARSSAKFALAFVLFAALAGTPAFAAGGGGTESGDGGGHEPGEGSRISAPTAQIAPKLVTTPISKCAPLQNPTLEPKCYI